MLEPNPRQLASLYEPVQWAKGTVLELEPLSSLPIADLHALLRNRRTQRRFGTLTTIQLGNLLGLACQTQAARASPYGFPQELRMHPSAGAIHPIHVLCQRQLDGAWERYDPVRHALVEIPGTERFAVGARACVSEIVNSGAAVLIALVAEAGKTHAKYTASESLVNRDGGVVLGYLSIVAEALGLNFCPLGVMGDAFVAPLAPSGLLQGAGLLLVGSRPADVVL